MTVPDPPNSNLPHTLVFQNGVVQWIPEPSKSSNILKEIPNVLRGLIGSKKAITTFAGLAAGIGTYIFGGNNISTEELMTLMSPVLAYVLGQGIADHGKEAAKIKPPTSGDPNKKQ